MRRVSVVVMLTVLALGRVASAQGVAGEGASAGAAGGGRSDRTTVSQLARLEGQGETVLRGLGLVFGLAGTGDSGKDLPLARPLMEFYRNNGNPLGSIDELKGARSVALVSVTCVVPAGGARADDVLSVSVQAVHNAKSIEGGELYLTALQGPYTTGASAQIFAMAQGRVVVEDKTSPRVGTVRGGGRMVRDVNTTPAVSDAFTLILRPEFAGFASASEIAGRIRDEYNGRRPVDPAESLPAVATVVDDRTIRIDVPPAERSAPAGFVGSVMQTTVNPALLGLPARVVCNQSAGIIVMTGDVEISPVAITQRELSITTTVPMPQPTPDNPLVRTERWAGLATGARAGERARLADLLEAFNQLKIPVSEQIAILSMLERAGKLHAQLIIQ